MKQPSSMATRLSSWRESCASVALRAPILAGMPILLTSLIANSSAATADISLLRLAGMNSSRAGALVDLDGDGLDDLLERATCTAPDRVDSDYDEWNDAEELARGSIASVNCSQPHCSQSYSVGGRAYLRDGYLHGVFGVYLRSASLSQVSLDIGLRSNQTMAIVPPASYAGRMAITTVPTHTPGETLLVVDVVLPSSPLQRTGSMSLFASLRTSAGVVCADSVNLVLQGGVLVELIPPSDVSPGAAELLGDGLIHRPLGGTQLPANWTSGQVCFQRTEPVGSHGAVVTQEVTTASCLDGWDGYCDGASCGSSVGTTVDLVDPTALVGG